MPVLLRPSPVRDATVQMMFTVVARTPTLSARPSLHVRRVMSLFLLLYVPIVFAARCVSAQASPQQVPVAAAKPPQEKSAEHAEPQTPAQIELLETHYRF